MEIQSSAQRLWYKRSGKETDLKKNWAWRWWFKEKSSMFQTSPTPFKKAGK